MIFYKIRQITFKLNNDDHFKSKRFIIKIRYGPKKMSSKIICHFDVDDAACNHNVHLTTLWIKWSSFDWIEILIFNTSYRWNKKKMVYCNHSILPASSDNILYNSINISATKNKKKKPTTNEIYHSKLKPSTRPLYCICLALKNIFSSFAPGSVLCCSVFHQFRRKKNVFGFFLFYLCQFKTHKTPRTQWNLHFHRLYRVSEQ